MARCSPSPFPLRDPSPDPVARFDFIACVHGDSARIALFGELDSSSAPVLTLGMERLRGCVKDLVLDLTLLEFLGAAGLTVFADAADALAEGGTLTLIAPTTSTRRLLALVPLPTCVRVEPAQSPPLATSDVLAALATS